MNKHPFLRAYLAGIAVPTVFLLVIMTGYTCARYVWNIPLPIERVIVFPMAAVIHAPGVHAHLDVHWPVILTMIPLACVAMTSLGLLLGTTFEPRNIGLMFGFVFAKNFDSPYLAQSITDFWRRWHISLSTFLRDYLYIPLGGNRRGSLRTYVNLFLTMLLRGLWHRKPAAGHC